MWKKRIRHPIILPEIVSSNFHDIMHLLLYIARKEYSDNSGEHHALSLQPINLIVPSLRVEGSSFLLGGFHLDYALLVCEIKSRVAVTSN